MFSIEDFLSQGDLTSLELDLSGQCFVDQDFAGLEFLNSISEKTDFSVSAPSDDNHLTDMNLDLKELLSGMLPDDGPAVDISLLDAAMPVSELSYNLNSVLGVDSSEMCVAVSETSAAAAAPPHSEDDFEVCESPEEVSSTSTTRRGSSEGGEEGESVAGKKYLEMRRKNNIASQRSRKVRKQKNSEMCGRLKELERENKELSLLAESLEREKNTLQELLMGIIARRS